MQNYQTKSLNILTITVNVMNDYMKPKSITVGYNANPKDIEKIKQICNKNDISFYKLDKANDGTFKTVR